MCTTKIFITFVIFIKFQLCWYVEEFRVLSRCDLNTKVWRLQSWRHLALLTAVSVIGKIIGWIWKLDTVRELCFFPGIGRWYFGHVREYRYADWEPAAAAGDRRPQVGGQGPSRETGDSEGQTGTGQGQVDGIWKGENTAATGDNICLSIFFSLRTVSLIIIITMRAIMETTRTLDNNNNNNNIFLVVNLTYGRMITSIVLMDDSKLLRESNLTAQQPCRAPILL